MILLGLSLCTGLLFVSALFSTSETALLSMPPQELKRLALRVPSLEKYVHTWLTKPQKLIITILVGNTLTDVAFSSALTFIALNTLFFWPGRVVEAIAWVTSCVLTTCLAEILPKLLGRRHPEPFSRVAFPLLSFFGRLFKPLLFFLEKALAPFLKGKPMAADRGSLGFSSDELMNVLVDSGKDLEISPECLDMMKRTLEMHRRSAQDIMTPLERMEFIDWARASAHGDEIIDFFVEKGHTRVPIMKDGVVIGILHTKDILKSIVKTPSKPTDLEKMVRPPVTVKGDRPVGELLEDFQSRRVHMALVSNPNGSVIGLITLEDILEEITGEILDEYDL